MGSVHRSPIPILTSKEDGEDPTLPPALRTVRAILLRPLVEGNPLGRGCCHSPCAACRSCTLLRSYWAVLQACRTTFTNPSRLSLQPRQRETLPRELQFSKPEYQRAVWVEIPSTLHALSPVDTACSYAPAQRRPQGAQHATPQAKRKIYTPSGIPTERPVELPAPIPLRAESYLRRGIYEPTPSPIAG